jgi:hypothetical protein
VSGRDLPLVAARSGTERERLRLAGKRGLGVAWRLIVKVWIGGIALTLTIKCQIHSKAPESGTLGRVHP